MLTFTPNQTESEQQQSILIINDNTPEISEHFTAIISVVSAEGKMVSISNSPAFIIIEDDDGKH